MSTEDQLPPHVVIFIEEGSDFSKSLDGIDTPTNSDALPILFISAFDDGTVNRWGSINESFTGRIDSEYNTTFVMGISEDGLYWRLLGAITQELVELNGSHYLTDQQEPQYHLFLEIRTEENKGLDIDYYYSSESPRLPAAIQEYVLKAEMLTDEWHKKS